MRPSYLGYKCISKVLSQIINYESKEYVSEQFLLRNNYLLLVYKYMNPTQEYRLSGNFLIV